MNVITQTINVVNFKTDKTYNLSSFWSRDYNIAILSDDEIKNVKEAVNKTTSPIVDGDVVLFKESSFPKLFLKEIGCNITRTIKADKATKIVTDSCNVIQPEDIAGFESVILAESITGEYYKFDKNNLAYAKINFEEFAKNNSFELIPNAYLVPNTLTNKKLNNIQYRDKLSTNIDLITYLNNFLPTPTEDQKDMLLSLLRSGDANNIELGINMVRMFNVSNCIFDIYAALAGDDHWNAGRGLNGKNTNNIRFKYLMSIGQFQLKTFRNFNQHYRSIEKELFHIYSLPFITLDQKQKCWIQAYCIQTYQRAAGKKRYFEAPNVEKMKLRDSDLTKYGFPERYADVS